MTKKNVLDRAETVLRRAFGILFLITGFLHATNLTFGKPVISFFQWPAVALGGAVFLLRIVRFKRFWKDRLLWVLIAFAASFLVSMLLSAHTALYENLRFFIFLCLQIGVLYAFPVGESEEERLGEWRILAALYIAGTFVISLIGIVFFFSGYQQVIPQEKGPTICIGFVWGRLFGAWWDPNIGAVAAAFSILLSIGFIRRARRVLIAVPLIVNILIQLFDIVFSDSRSGQLALTVGIAVYGYFGFRRLFAEHLKKNALRIAVCLIAAALAGAATFAFVKFIKPPAGATYDFLPEGEDFGREQDIENDVTNRRLDIWKSAVEIWKEKPLFGTSRAGIVPFAEKNLPETYILKENNGHMTFDTMHNLFFDVLVSQGALGAVIFLGFVGLTLALFIRRGKKIFAGPDPALLFALVVTLVLISMLMTEIFYVISPTSTLAWISLSVLMQKGAKKE